MKNANIFRKYGMKQNEMASFLHLTRQSISDWKVIPDKYIRKIANFYKVDLDVVWNLQRELWEIAYPE